MLANLGAAVDRCMRDDQAVSLHDIRQKVGFNAFLHCSPFVSRLGNTSTLTCRQKADGLLDRNLSAMSNFLTMLGEITEMVMDGKLAFPRVPIHGLGGK